MLIDKLKAIDAVEDIDASVSVCASVAEAKGMMRMKANAVDALNEVPEVKAIPIEWIEGYLKKLAEEHKAERTLTVAIVRLMIKDWEDESGR